MLIGAFNFNVLAQKTKNDVKRFKKEKSTFAPYVNRTGLLYDKNFIYKGEEVNIKILRECMYDSKLRYTRIDTLYRQKVINYTTYFGHNDFIIFKVTKSGVTNVYKIDKMLFADKIPDYMITASNGYIVSLDMIMKEQPKLLFTSVFCAHATDHCMEAFAVFNWENGDVEFYDKNSMSCVSPVQAIEGKAILSNDALYDYEGSIILDLSTQQRYTAFSEFIDSSSFLYILDPIIETRPSGNRSRRKRDSVTDNARVYDLNGKLKYSFKYYRYDFSISYYVPHVNQKELNQIMLFDFLNEKYYIVKSDRVDEYNFVEIKDTSIFSDFKEYDIQDNLGYFEVYVNGNIAVYFDKSGNRDFLKEK